MNSEGDDHMELLSQYYPEGIMSHFVEDQGRVVEAKPRRRRRKNKGGEDGGDGVMRKRKLSEEQVNMLEKCFGSEHKLESERKDRLAAELGMDPRQVAVWFQNRRARWKCKKLEEEYNKLRSEHESTVVEKCRLQSEVMKMKDQLNEAEKEIQRLSLERHDGFASNSPSSSSIDTANMDRPGFLGGVDQFRMEELMDNYVFNYGHGLELDNNIYYM